MSDQNSSKWIFLKIWAADTLVLPSFLPYETTTQSDTDTKKSVV